MLQVREFVRDAEIRPAEVGEPPPLVSVILPTHRRRDTLSRAIETVLAQTLPEIELLVMDDGSTDGSAQLVAETRARDPRVIHVRHEQNCGLPALRVNEGIELARGRFLAFQFDDDAWRPHALEVLVATAESQPEPSVVVGRAHFRGKAGEWSLPSVPIDLVTLTEQNRFANNSVLVPREIVDRHGMYDCHIGMRRLCDWDLWLRYIRHVPFVVADEVVSEVFEATPGSIGLTVPWDLPLFRYLHDIPRDELLTPTRWREYVVDALRIAEVEVEKDLRRRLYEEHIVPYYLRYRHRFPQLEGFPATLPVRRTVLYTKNSYDVSNDVTLNHYDRPCSARGTYKTHYQPLGQVEPTWPRDADALLLVRTVEDAAAGALDAALAQNVPVGFYLDDDLLSFHEYGAEFSYLAPGTPYHRNLSEAIRRADTVWVTNSFIEASVASLNPRIIPHNNAVPAAALPARISPRRRDRPLRVGYAGSGYRIEEFRAIWEGLREVSYEQGDGLEFEFWGLDVSSLPPLRSPVVQRPFTFSYPAYLRRLQATQFDVLLTPLLDRPRPRLAKSLIKYYECAVAGALGIFSDVPQYRGLAEGETCLKAANTPESWATALRRASGMASAEFDHIRERALAQVREEYTETAQIHKHEAAWRATEFHGRTRGSRHEDGRPRVLYVLHSAHFGGGEIQLWRRLRLARRYGIEPIVVMPRILQPTEAALRVVAELERDGIQAEFVDYTCFDQPRSPQEFKSDLERGQVGRLLERTRPAVVHTVTFIPSFGQVCEELGIPHVASLYAVDDAFEWARGSAGFTHAEVVQSDSLRYANRWSRLLAAEKLLAREVVPEEVFTLGRRRRERTRGSTAEPPPGPLRLVVTGTLQERKRQLETIEAIGRLRAEGIECLLDLYGYTHFFPEYLAACEQRIRSHGLEDLVRFRGFSTDVASILGAADVVLSLSTYESFPSAIKEAMAGGVLVVATPVGGIPELIVDGVTGILCADTSVEAIIEGIRRAVTLTDAERELIVEQARRVARSEFHPHRAASDMLQMYNRALDLGGRRGSPTTPIPPEPPTPNVLGRMRAPSGPPGGHVLLTRPVSYCVRPGEGGWLGLDVFVGTHGTPASGRIGLEVITSNGALLRVAAAELAGAPDNSWLAFRFIPVRNSNGHCLTLRFRLLGARRETRVSLYERGAGEPRVRRLARRLGVPLGGNELYCRLWYDIS